MVDRDTAPSDGFCRQDVHLSLCSHLVFDLTVWSNRGRPRPRCPLSTGDCDVTLAQGDWTAFNYFAKIQPGELRSG